MSRGEENNGGGRARAPGDCGVEHLPTITFKSLTASLNSSLSSSENEFMVFWRRSWISEAVAFRFDDEVALRFVAEPTPSEARARRHCQAARLEVNLSRILVPHYQDLSIRMGF